MRNGKKRTEQDKAVRRAARRRAGVTGRCTQCNKPHTNGARKYCDACKTVAAGLAKVRRRGAPGSGRCTTCNKKHTNGPGVNCDECRASAKNRRAGLIAAGLCVKCREPRDGPFKKCNACTKAYNDKNAARMADRKARGLCSYCSTPCYQHGERLCTVCLLKAVAMSTLGSTKRWPELRTLFDKQEAKCAYTGVDIVIREARRSDQRFTASLDHKVPRSLGGPDSIENLQWVSWLVNRAKTDMTHEQFIEMCSVVVERDRGEKQAKLGAVKEAKNKNSTQRKKR